MTEFFTGAIRWARAFDRVLTDTEIMEVVKEMKPLTLALGLGAIPDPNGLYWVCGDCFPLTNGRYSLTWQPPDQRLGKCEHCGRHYEFSSGYGEVELIAALEEAP